MKNTILRILTGGILFSLLAGIIVSIIGVINDWETSTQYSDGFFWAGLTMISIGLITYQGYRQRFIDWPPVNLAPADRESLWSADIFRGKTIMVVFGVSGLLLFGMSLLVLRLF